MSRRVSAVLIDGPLARKHPALSERIDLTPGGADGALSRRHAAAMAEAMLVNAPNLALVSLCVFGPRLSTDVATVTRALRLAAEREAEIVHCSFGLQRKDVGLADAVADLVAQGRLVVAAAPARGGPVFPAAYPGVISVQGDARCEAGAWSWLNLPTAQFGACPSLAKGSEVAGGSVAAAHFTGHVANLQARGVDDLHAALRSRAAFVGRERRGRPTAPLQPEQ